MKGYDLERLDSREFEKLCADIIERETGKRVERFPAGKDGGVDGRFWVGENKKAIVQAKHYPEAKKAKIKSLLATELPKVKKIKPERYIFVVSAKISQPAKNELLKDFDGYIKNPSDVWGFDDIQGFLLKEENFDIVEKYLQLYVYSTTLLKKILGETITNSLLSGVTDRGEYLLENIKKNSCKFVYTDDYNSALGVLNEKNVVVITGEAGIGKTTLSNMLAFECIKNNYKFYSIENIKEAEDIVSKNESEHLVFYFDDFLGENFMNITKGDDSSHIMLFIERVRRSKKIKFILNSRTTIINKAHNIFPSLEKGNIKTNEYVLQIENLKQIDKARMLYKHMYFSLLEPEYLDEIYHEKKYWEVIDHSNFNPRIIEYILNKERVQFASVSSDNYYAYIEDKLDNPKDIWGDYFEKLDQCTQALVLLVAFNNGRISETDLVNSFTTYCSENGLSGREEASFKYVIRIALNSLLTRNKIFQSNEFEYTLFNPSLGDYVIENYFKNNVSELQKLTHALSNVTSINYLSSLKTSKNISENNFNSVLKRTFDELHKIKLIEGEWDWLIEIIYSDIKVGNEDAVINVLSQLTALDKHDAEKLYLNNFYKLHYALTQFYQVTTDKHDFLWAYLGSGLNSYDFESLFYYFEEKDIDDHDLLESLAELYEEYISENIEDYLDIDYTKYVDMIGPDDYDVDEQSIKEEIYETISDNFLNSENRDVLEKSSFAISSVIERLDNNYEDRAMEMLQDNVVSFQTRDRDKEPEVIFDSKGEIDEMFKRD